MRAFLVVFLIVNFSLSADLSKLTNSQKEILAKTYIKAKPYGLEFQMMAIAWKESRFGLEPVNLNDPSCGVFHNLIETVAKNNGLSRGKYADNRICSQLINDFEFSFNEALDVLLFYRDYFKNDWRKAVKAYNAGFKIKNGESYYKDILKRIIQLKLFVEDNKKAFEMLEEIR